MKDPNILPCYKCGGSAYAHTPDGQDKFENVRCRKCGHENGWQKSEGGDYEAASARAVEEWNEISAAFARLEELEGGELQEARLER